MHIFTDFLLFSFQRKHLMIDEASWEDDLISTWLQTEESTAVHKITSCVVFVPFQGILIRFHLHF